MNTHPGAWSKVSARPVSPADMNGAISRYPTKFITPMKPSQSQNRRGKPVPHDWAIASSTAPITRLHTGPAKRGDDLLR
jgi:hypothetical protein